MADIKTFWDPDGHRGDWAIVDGDLVIVTGDHETGYLTGPDSDPAWNPIVNNGAGVLPGMEWHSTNHTNSLMVLSAKGDAARMFNSLDTGFDPVHGRYADNTDVAKVVFWAMDPN